MIPAVIPVASVEALARALPRTPLAVLPTPLVAAPRLAEALGTGPLLVKRDDLTGFAFGGNKARLLEFLVAAATTDGADTLLTGGAAGSNFCAAAAAAARRAGLGCELVIAGRAASPGPALALARSWGAAVRWTGVPERDSVDAALPAVARELTAAGRRPYLIPRGGATGLGAVGYALAAAELHAQLDELGRRDVTVLVPPDPVGTLAGLVAGHMLLGRPWALLGGSASRPPRVAARLVLSLARDCLRRARRWHRSWHRTGPGRRHRRRRPRPRSRRALGGRPGRRRAGDEDGGTDARPGVHGQGAGPGPDEPARGLLAHRRRA